MRQLVIISVILVMAGSTNSQEKPKYEAVPDYRVLLAIASQANCPLKIEAATFLKRVDRPGVLIKYRVKNISKKPIQFVSVMIQNASGTNENFMPIWSAKKPLLPNETLECSTVEVDYDLVSHSNLGQNEDTEMRSLYILLVDKVQFLDRSVYEDPKTLASLFKFFQDGCNR